MPLSLDKLHDELRVAAGRWNAGATSIWERRPHQSASEQLLVERGSFARRARKPWRDLPLQDACDLRSRDGRNFVAPVRDARSASPQVYAIWRVVESTLRVSYGDPKFELVHDDLDRVTQSTHGTWLDEPALDTTLTVRGGYLDAETVRIERWHELRTIEVMKTWLTEHGPLLAVFAVHEDFYGYVNGVYHHVAGEFEGAHCVAVVGFDNAGEYWIVQNCWGDAWGESGHFRIAFGERGIDASMWGVEPRIVTSGLGC